MCAKLLTNVDTTKFFPNNETIRREKYEKISPIEKKCVLLSPNNNKTTI